MGVIAGWRIGMWLDNTRTMRRRVDLLVKERPAAIVIADEFGYSPSDNEDEAPREEGEFVRPLTEAGSPT